MFYLKILPLLLSNLICLVYSGYKVFLAVVKFFFFFFFLHNFFLLRFASLSRGQPYLQIQKRGHFGRGGSYFLQVNFLCVKKNH